VSDDETRDIGSFPAHGGGDPKKLVGRVIADKYELTRHVGGGGFGEVYEATNVNLAEQKLVIKFIRRVDSPERFKKEATILCLLNHPNICRIVDYLPNEGALVMPYIEGKDCQDLLDEDSQLDEALILKIARCVTSAIAYAHSQRIAHRDIKPGNIMVDHNQQVLLIDFGIAKEMDAEALTRTGYQVLTPQYAAPERMTPGKVKDYDPFLSDIFEIGSTIHKLATRHTPFEEVRHIHDRSAGKSRPLSRRMKKILKKATRPSPEARYQSATELASDLESIKRVYGTSWWKLAIIPVVLVASIATYVMVTKTNIQEATVPTDSIEVIDTLQDSVISAVDVKPDSLVAMTKDSAAATEGPSEEDPDELPKSEADKSTISQTPVEPPPEPPKSKLQVSVVPRFNSSLFINNVEKNPGQEYSVEPGKYEVKIINPDYPIVIDSVDVQVDRSKQYTLTDNAVPDRELALFIGSGQDLGDSYMRFELNGKERNYYSSDLPISNISVPLGKWHLKFEVVEFSGESHAVDSFITFPYGGGPRIKVDGNEAVVDFGKPQWRDYRRVDLVVYWNELE